MERWDGSRWRFVASPTVGSAAVLNGVAAISPTDAWAIGSYQDRNNVTHALAIHWDGTKWSIVPTPDPGSQGNALFDVSGSSSSDVWAVGFSNLGSQTLIEHWNGVSWEVVSSPNPGNEFNYLFGVSVTSAADVWAVGYSFNFADRDNTLVEHWDGTSWSVTPSSDAGDNSFLYSVSSVSTSTAWGVGNYTQDFEANTLIEQWDGTGWMLVPSPNIGDNGSSLRGVWAAGSTEAFAVGQVITADNKIRPLIERIC